MQGVEEGIDPECVDAGVVTGAGAQQPLGGLRQRRVGPRGGGPCLFRQHLLRPQLAHDVLDFLLARQHAVLLGVPAWRTSLSPTGAGETPGAVREALRRYSPTLMGPPPIDLNTILRIADAGDVDEPDGRVRAHPDLATAHRAIDAQEHVRLGANVVSVNAFWTVLTAPGGQVYCLTDRDPATGRVAGV